MFQDGQRLGEFEILERLGQGGMGAVYKARQVSLRRTVAIKTLQASLAADAEYIARFHNEAAAAAALNHPNLVQVYSAGENDGLHWFAMEYVEGESAQVRLKRKGCIEPVEAIAICMHVATALDYGWRKAGLIHRDIKPDNIFLSGDGEVKLGDLGLAKVAEQTQGLTVTGASMGTPHYVSPEQAEGRKDVDLRADIYSLGCTLFHLLSGKPPYSGDSALAVMMKHVSAPVPNLKQVWPECPEELARVVMKMMLKQPAARPQTYAEVIADLRRAYDTLTGASVPNVMAVTRQPQEPAGRPVEQAVTKAGGAAPNPQSAIPNPKSKAPLLAGIAALVAILGIAGWFVFGKKEPKLTEAERAEKAKSSPALQRVEPSATAGRPDGLKPGTTLPAASPEATAFLAKASKDKPFVNSLGMKFVPVPVLSGPTANQRVLFSVWVTRVEDYAAYAKAQEAAGKKVDGSWKTQHRDSVPAGRELDHPVVGVSWDDAQAFCAWLTVRDQTQGMLPPGVKYRLPSDEEWSWAVGLPPEVGGTHEEKNGKNDVDFPWGKDWPPVKKVGNYADETFHAKFPVRKNEKDGKMENEQWIKDYTDGYATTSPVGAFPANAYGLYDMGGNVWQWCEDWWNAEHKDRVLRGASWDYNVRYYLRSSHRLHPPATRRNYSDGFRCVVSAKSAPKTA